MTSQEFLARFCLPETAAAIGPYDTVVVCENPQQSTAETFRFSMDDYANYFIRVTAEYWSYGSKITVMDKPTYLRYLSAFGRRSTDHGNSPQSTAAESDYSPRHIRPKR